MTQLIEVSDTSVGKIFSAGSRYVKSQQIIYYGEQRFLTLDLYIRRKYQPTGKESVMVINKGVEYRPDLVANQLLGAPELWWRIMEANNMKDIMEFKAGKTILIPGYQ